MAHVDENAVMAQLANGKAGTRGGAAPTTR